MHKVTQLPVRETIEPGIADKKNSIEITEFMTLTRTVIVVAFALFCAIAEAQMAGGWQPITDPNAANSQSKLAARFAANKINSHFGSTSTLSV